VKLRLELKVHRPYSNWRAWCNNMASHIIGISR